VAPVPTKPIGGFALVFSVGGFASLYQPVAVALVTAESVASHVSGIPLLTCGSLSLVHTFAWYA
jgi:hypothetical protein